MLSNDTKKIVTEARNTVVGRLPSPTDQCEQITMALIYKFMSNIDRETESIGDQPEFFPDHARKYAWDELMDMSHSADEVYQIYSEGLSYIAERIDLEEVFSATFKDAHIPYNDSRTLRAFLNIIDRFDTDDTENIGDAFELMLQDTGAQGKAGQFRTPRHIIDFIVRIVAPKKHEVILDPACGTAGFLASAYDHVSSQDDLTLTASDRDTVAKNLIGYDNAPQMVKLSTVNMYLHHRQTPNIIEFDSLTDPGKWNQYADVILANPPFFTERGGVKPHDRFGIKSKKSEVLFLDYITSHLSADGRAGIIVPEGILFTNHEAHKKLRKELAESSLVAVISLPAGAFNPYSSVKTSILIMNKPLARKANHIAFFKVQHDGYDLGSHRRPMSQDDLPAVAAEINEYLRRLHSGETLDSFTPSLGMLVPRADIAANGEYNLNGERYAEGRLQESPYPMTYMKEICELVRGVTYAKADEIESEGLKVLRANNIDRASFTLDLADIKMLSKSVNLDENKKLLKNDIFICMSSGSKSHIGKVAFIPGDTDYYFGGFMGVVRSKLDRVEPLFLFYQLCNKHFNDYLRQQIAGANINNLNAKIFYEFQIPLPPLAIQKKILADIQAYEAMATLAGTLASNMAHCMETVTESVWEQSPASFLEQRFAGLQKKTEQLIASTATTYAQIQEGIERNTQKDTTGENPDQTSQPIAEVTPREMVEKDASR